MIDYGINFPATTVLSDIHFFLPKYHHSILMFSLYWFSLFSAFPHKIYILSTEKKTKKQQNKQQNKNKNNIKGSMSLF